MSGIRTLICLLVIVFAAFMAPTPAISKEPADDANNKPAATSCPSTQSCGQYQGRLYPVKVDNKWGYINKEGTVVVRPRYEDAGDFEDGVGRVHTTYSHYFIDCSGKEVVGPVLSAPYCHEGLISVMVHDEWGDQWGCVDRSGQWVLQPAYIGPPEFSDGMALVGVQDKFKLPWEQEGRKHFFYIDKKGNKVFEPPSDLHLWYFHEGLAAFESGSKGMPPTDGIRGYMDKSGKVVIEAQYKRAGDFSGGLAAVQKESKWGFIDKKGREVIPMQFDNAEGFSEGLAAVSLDKRWGFVDANGFLAIPYKYNAVYQGFSEGLAPVRTGEGTKGKWGYIDKEGALKIPPKFDTAYTFRDGLARVIDDGDDQYIDPNGAVVWP